MRLNYFLSAAIAVVAGAAALPKDALHKVICGAEILTVPVPVDSVKVVAAGSKGVNLLMSAP